VVTVADIAGRPELQVELLAGDRARGSAIAAARISELEDPTELIERGTLLLTAGRGLGERPAAQRGYVRRLAACGAAGLAVALGEHLDAIPPAVLREAARLELPVLAVSGRDALAALVRATSGDAEGSDGHLRALGVQEELVRAAVDGAPLRELLAIVAGELRCSVQLREGGAVVAEHHARGSLAFDGPCALRLDVVAPDAHAELVAVRAEGGWSGFDRLVLRHGQGALAMELTRRHAVRAAELRLAGNLFDDLEHERLEEEEIAGRIAAFGLERAGSFATLVALPGDRGGERLRAAIESQLNRSGARHLSTVRPETVAFLVAEGDEDQLRALAERVVAAEQGPVRIAVGRLASGRALGRSLLEARAVLRTARQPVVSYLDLGPLELLLSVPSSLLESYVDRVLGPVAQNGWLMESLTELLDAGVRWKETADRLGVHRHTLRYRMNRLAEQTGRHPDDPADRMELWLAVRALETVELRRGGPSVGGTDQV
jgi:PucR family transcriptional regulator, purine catabolism regulatory protein